MHCYNNIFINVIKQTNKEWKAGRLAGPIVHRVKRVFASFHNTVEKEFKMIEGGTWMYV